MTELFLGRASTGEVRLPLKALLRHVVCLGSSGSGKTVTCKVLCEELIRLGIPIIAVDPQGDIASLGVLGQEQDVAAKGTPVEIFTSFRDRAEVVVWTPGSALGVPLAVNPLASISELKGVSEDDILRERGFAAEALADLAGFDLRSAKGRTVTTLFSLLLEHAAGSSQPLTGVEGVVRLLETMPTDLKNRVSGVVDNLALLDEVIQRTRLLTVGTQSHLLSDGVPLDIDMLLGGGRADLQASRGKTRLSIIYINTLATERERQFFVGQLALALYRWMLKHPKAEPQALFYIDEVAPYLPPVKKPVCKDALGLLFRQARKYGVCCLAATQSPGDIDYKALGQVSTWCLGRLVVRQDVKKVETQLKALSPDHAEAIVAKLPAFTPGRSVLLSPDTFPAPIEMQTRWLVTQHRTLNETELSQVTSADLRRRLEKAASMTEESGTGDRGAADDEEPLGGLAVGRVEIAVLAVANNDEGVVASYEIVVQRGTGKITTLGNMDSVSRESFKVAWQAATQLQAELGLPHRLDKRYDVTVLGTRLAVRKGGPSAGLAFLSGIVAAFCGTPPRPDIAMTGEISMLGKVTAVGGIEPKVKAAYEAGYATVLVPKENEGDVANLPADLRRAVEVIPVATVQEALPVIFATPRRSRPAPPRKILPDPKPPVAIPVESPPVAIPVGVPSSDLHELPEVDREVLDLLYREIAVLTGAEIADLLDKSAATVTKALKRLEEANRVKSIKRGRALAYYHAEHALRPEYGLMGPVEAVKLAIFEPEARKRAEGQLATSMFIFRSEEIASQRLVYLPLYKVRFSAKVKEGWVFTREVEKRDNLYFNGLTAELLNFQGNAFTFAGTVPANPVEVVDLDNLATFEQRSPGELPLDDAEMQALLQPKDIEKSALAKFQMTILETSLVFFPVWRFLIKSLSSKAERDLNIDGLKGQPLALSLPVRKKK